MSIINELKNRGVPIVKSENLYKGYYNTPKGVVISMDKSECEDGIYFLMNSNGKIFPCDDHMVYVLTGTEYAGKVSTNKEAQQLAKEGKIYSFKSSDLYDEYYDFKNNKELECCFKYRYSSRSREYIESVMKEIGLIKYTEASNGSMSADGEPTMFEILHEYNLFMNATTEVGKLEDGLWIAQTCYQIEIDDFAVIKMYFDHDPSVNNIRKAFAIRSFESKPIEIFTCWECGRLTNWLDINGDIDKKYEMARERYCGC